jgi:periplasmic divalent cation tolerance protein
MIAKLAAERAERAVDYIRSHHPYEMPAVLVLPVESGNADYLSWLRAGTRT